MYSTASVVPGTKDTPRTGSSVKVSWVRAPMGRLTRCTWLVWPKRVVMIIALPSWDRSCMKAQRVLRYWPSRARSDAGIFGVPWSTRLPWTVFLGPADLAGSSGTGGGGDSGHFGAGGGWVAQQAPRQRQSRLGIRCRNLVVNTAALPWW